MTSIARQRAVFPAMCALIGAAWFGACGDGEDADASGGTAGDASIDGTGANGGTGGVAGGGMSGSSGNDGPDGQSGSGGSTALFDCEPGSGTLPALKFTEVVSGLTRPLLALSPPEDATRLVVVEQDGIIHMHKNGVLLPTPFLDLSSRVTREFNEQGLLGVAFHPDYLNNGRFFVHYSANGVTEPKGDTVVSEFNRSTEDSDVADPDSEKIILTVAQPEPNHNGGSIGFRSDGFLYVGLGDGGGAGDLHGTAGNGQATDTLLGKILRIDVDNPAAGQNYGIPVGNMSGSGVAPELWNYGWRNNYRWSFDLCTGDMYIADVGQNTIEEINVEPATAPSGRNYGWRVMEGTKCFNPATGCDTSQKVLPAALYDHGKGCSVTGGYVYRGSKIAALRGFYLYSDFCSGRFWAFRWDGSKAKDLQEITQDLNPGGIAMISSFGQDATGEVYVTSFDLGRLFRIDPE